MRTQTRSDTYRPSADELFQGAARGATTETVDKSFSILTARLRIRRRASLDNLEGLGAFRLHDLRHNAVSWDVSRGVCWRSLARTSATAPGRRPMSTRIFAPTALKLAADERARAMREAMDTSAPDQA